MTFERPLWLLLLVALPLLWWLHRRLRAPREVVVASVEALRGARLDAAARRPRRTLDAELALVLGAAACAVLAAAGVRAGGRAPCVLVAVDTSASMGDAAVGAGTLGEAAWAGAMRALEAAAPRAEVVVVDLALPQQAGRAPRNGARSPPPHALRGDDLPGTLAPVLARARAEGFPGVLLVTDRTVDAGRDVVVSGPGTGALPRPVVVDAVLDGSEARVTVRRAKGASGVLEVAQDDGPGVRVPVPAGDGDVEVRAPAPPPGGSTTYRLVADRAAAALRVTRVGGVRRVALTGPRSGAPRLRALLQTLGVQVVDAALAEVDVEIVVGGRPTALRAGDAPRLRLAADAGGDGGVEVRAAPEGLAGEDVSAGGAAAGSAPGPGVALVRRGVLHVDAVPDGEWETADGAVAVWLPRRVVTTLDPEAPSSSWHVDPSFPVFVLSAFDHLAGGPDRLERVDAAPVTEILRDAAPPPVAAAAAVARLVRSEAADPGGRTPDAALSVIAGVLAALAVVAGSGRFSGPRRHRVAAP